VIVKSMTQFQYGFLGIFSREYKQILEDTTRLNFKQARFTLNDQPS